MTPKICVLSLLFICFINISWSYDASATTAPEFTVVVTENNYKEIYIPLTIWRRIAEDYKNKLYLKRINQTDLLSVQIINANPQYLNKFKLTELKQAVHNQDNTIDPDLIDEEEESVSVTPIPFTPNPSDPISNAVYAEAEAEAAAVMSSPDVQMVSGVPQVVVQATRAPCFCSGGTCSCCATILKQKSCTNIKFNSEDFFFDMDVTVNGEKVIRRVLPVSNSPPICFNPRRAPFLELCARINNIHVKKQNVHMCIDIDANIGEFDLLSWNYNCLKFGFEGIQTGLEQVSVTVKPAPIVPTVPIPEEEDDEEEDEDDDEDDDDDDEDDDAEDDDEDDDDDDGTDLFDGFDDDDDDLFDAFY